MRIKKFVIGVVIMVILATVTTAVLLSVAFSYHKHFIESVIGQALGATVKIGSIYIDVKNNALRITDFRLYNPKGFAEEETLAYLPRIIAEYDPKSLIVNRKLHFTTLGIYVEEMIVVKNKDGKLNVEKLTIFKENFEELPLKADRLVLSAEYVIFKDFTKGEFVRIEPFNVNIKNEVYEGFPTVEDITAKVVSEILNKTTIKGAKLLGVAMLAGFAGGWSVIIPAEAVVLMTEKGGYRAILNVGYEDVYKASLDAAYELGKNIHEYKKNGMIKGDINGGDVVIKITDRPDGKTDVVVSASKYYFPKLNIAGGVLYAISQKLIMNKNMQNKKLFEKVQ